MELHCSTRELIPGFISFSKINCLSTERYKLICSFRQVNISLDMYIMTLYLSLVNSDDSDETSHLHCKSGCFESKHVRKHLLVTL